MSQSSRDWMCWNPCCTLKSQWFSFRFVYYCSLFSCQYEARLVIGLFLLHKTVEMCFCCSPAWYKNRFLHPPPWQNKTLKKHLIRDSTGCSFWPTNVDMQDVLQQWHLPIDHAQQALHQVSQVGHLCALVREDGAVHGGQLGQTLQRVLGHVRVLPDLPVYLQQRWWETRFHLVCFCFVFTEYEKRGILSSKTPNMLENERNGGKKRPDGLSGCGKPLHSVTFNNRLKKRRSFQSCPVAHLLHKKRQRQGWKNKKTKTSELSSILHVSLY